MLTTQAKTRLYKLKSLANILHITILVFHSCYSSHHHAPTCTASVNWFLRPPPHLRFFVAVNTGPRFFTINQ